MLGPRWFAAVVLGCILTLQVASYNSYNSSSFQSAHADSQNTKPQDLIGKGYRYDASIQITILPPLVEHTDSISLNARISEVLSKYNPQTDEFTLQTTTTIVGDVPGGKQTTSYENVIHHDASSNAETSREIWISFIQDMFTASGFTTKLHSATVKAAGPATIELQGSRYIGVVYETEGIFDLTYNGPTPETFSMKYEEKDQIFAETGLLYQAGAELTGLKEAESLSFKFHSALENSDISPGIPIKTQSLSSETVTTTEAKNSTSITFLYGSDTTIQSKDLKLKQGYIALNYETEQYAKEAMITILVPNQLMRDTNLSLSSLQVEVDGKKHTDISLTGISSDAFITVRNLPLGQHKIKFSFTAPISETEVTGTYINSNVGLQIDFPEGWKGFEINKENQTLVLVTSGITSQPSGKLTDFAMMMVIIGNISEGFSVNTSETKCEMPPSAAIITLVDMKAMEFAMKCSAQAMPFKVKAYMLLSKEKIIGVMYGAASDTTYDNNIAKFEESLKTLKIKNTIDISDLSSYAPLFGLTLSKQVVQVSGNSYDLEIASNSTITDFTFSEENKQISFKLEGKEGTKGSTTIYFGKVLKGPYIVTVDGKAVNDFMVIEDTTTGETSIDLPYKDGIHEITITGANLVPQVPVPEKIPREQKTDNISVIMKAKKKSTLLSIKNNSEEPVYEIKLHVSQGSIKFIKAKGWDREKIDSSTVMIKTTDRPITTGRTMVLLMITDNPNASIEWSVLDKDMKTIGGGTVGTK